MDSVSNETRDTLKFSLFLGLFALFLILSGLTVVVYFPEMKQWFKPPSQSILYVKGTSKLVEVTEVKAGPSGLLFVPDEQGWITTVDGMTFNVSNEYIRQVVAEGEIRVYSALGVNWVSPSGSTILVVSDDYEPIDGMVEIKTAADLRNAFQPRDINTEVVQFSFCFGIMLTITVWFFYKAKEYM